MGYEMSQDRNLRSQIKREKKRKSSNSLTVLEEQNLDVKICQWERILGNTIGSKLGHKEGETLGLKLNTKGKLSLSMNAIQPQVCSVHDGMR